MRKLFRRGSALSLGGRNAAGSGSGFGSDGHRSTRRRPDRGGVQLDRLLYRRPWRRRLGTRGDDLLGSARVQVFRTAGPISFSIQARSALASATRAMSTAGSGASRPATTGSKAPGSFGIEADIQASGERGDQFLSFVIPAFVAPLAQGVTPATTVTIAAEHKLNWFGTLRGRLGVLPTDRFLLYVTGGLAYGELKSNYLSASAPSGRWRWVRRRQRRATWSAPEPKERSGATGPPRPNISTWISAHSMSRVCRPRRTSSTRRHRIQHRNDLQHEREHAVHRPHLPRRSELPLL